MNSDAPYPSSAGLQTNVAKTEAVTVARQITTHHVNGCNEAIELIAGRIGAGNAPVRYDVSYGMNGLGLKFQDGPVLEDGNGINGITNEVLLAIVRDRLECFQKGPYACRENALALTKIEEAMHWLHSRTRQRVARGVEGTHTV